MNKDKNLQRENRGWLRNRYSKITRSRTAMSYSLESLEPRVLFAADLAAAAPIIPEMVTEAPQQAVILNTAEIPSAAATSEQAQMKETMGPLLAQEPTSAHATSPQAISSSSVSTTTQFSRLFPDLPSFSADTPAIRAALLELGKQGGLLDAGDDLRDPKTLITDPSKSTHNPDNPAMTAGMTFLGQFLDHDLTFDQISHLGQSQDPTSLANARTPAFDLDSVYGGGPEVSPQLYDQCADGRGIKFLIEEIPGSASQSRGRIVRYDVPRDEHGVAVIADPRNDENVMISQLHLAFLRFHNAVVDHISSTTGITDPAQLFEEAQRTVQWHYQWIIANEFLPKTVGPELSESVFTEGPKFYDARHDPSMPVEFSGAAYRFGHSQVRPSYRANFGPAPGQEFFALVFDDTLPASQDHADLRGGERAARRFVDWQTFFDFGDGNVRPNKKIDTHLSSVLFDLPMIPNAIMFPNAEPQSLAQRNLLRHLTYGVPSGQDIAKAMGLEPLPPTAFEDVKPLGLETQTPLWFYILREAEVLEQGQRLGPVGGRIVADVFVGLLQHDPASYLHQNPDWNPTLTHTGAFTMVDLLNRAGVVVPV